MAELFVEAYDSSGHLVSGAIWCDGPKAGTKWMTTKILSRNRQVLIRRARKGEKHFGSWIVVDS